jgi:hypothetical protein
MLVFGYQPRNLIENLIELSEIMSIDVDMVEKLNRHRLAQLDSWRAYLVEKQLVRWAQRLEAISRSRTLKNIHTQLVILFYIRTTD